jgi:fibronectin-binding autotransporter adhesin
MKIPSRLILKTLQLLVFLIVSCVIAPWANAQSVWNAVINVSTDTNWSTAANWTPGGAPSGNVFFGDPTGVADATVNSFVDSSFGGTITGLLTTNVTTHQNILIGSGFTLHISGAAGLQATNGGGASGQVPITTISGPGAAIVVNNASANIFAGINGASGVGPQTLDLSGLDTLHFTGARMLSGVGTVSATPRCSGVLFLAKTNVITLTGTAPQVYVGENSQNTGNASALNLGQTNTIFADSLTVGSDKQSTGGSVGTSIIRFNSIFAGTGAGVYFRGHDGTSPMTSWDLAEGLGNTGGSTAPKGNIDFTGGSVDARVSYIQLSRPSPASSGSPTAISTLTFEAGIINVDTISNAITIAGSIGNPAATGTINVNNNGTTNGVLIVNNALVLATKNAGGGTSTGTLNVNGGTVQANNILAGAGGNATISLNSGTLIVTNNAGTPAAPLGTLNLANSGTATLQLSVAGAVAEMNTTNLNVGGAVTVNIGALPVITSYPKQFPLIGYVSFPGTFNFTLGTLPSGSPAYQGYISNNVANNSIDLVLTNGPTVTAVFQWTGAANGNWDFTSVDWKLLGSPLTYSNTSLVLFDDTTAVTNVNLTTNLSPGGVTVTNNANIYTFAGSGALIGSSGLTKSGTSTLLIANSGNNQFSGGVTINNGTLQFGNGGSSGNLPSGDSVLNNGSLVFNLSNTNSLLGIVSGTGSLVQNGSGVLMLSASNTYSGPTTVNNGTLIVDGSITGAGTVTSVAGTSLGGNGTVAGAVNASGKISPGDQNSIGTFTANGNVTLSAGSTAQFDVSSTDPTEGSGINDLLQVNGNLTVNNNTLGINVRGIPSAGFNYPVIAYTGTLTGTFNSTVAGTHYAANVDSVSTPGTVFVDITGSSGANVKWNSTSSGVWDTGTSNWFNVDTTLTDFYGNGDTVLLDDSVAGAQTNITIPAGVVIAPTAITNTGAFNYTISGGGTITGPTTLIKDGSGTLKISTTNSFTGGTVIINGTLVTGSATALGPSTGASITVSNFGTLDPNGLTLKGQTEHVSGTGAGGNGAVINGSTNQATLEFVTLNGDTTFGGSNDWRIANQQSGFATLNTAGSPVNITKTGPNQLLLVGVISTDPNIENLDIRQGSFEIQGTGPQPSTQFGDPNGTITVYSNANLQLNTPTVPITKNFVLNDGGILWTLGGVTNLGTVILTNNAANTAPGTGIITNNSGSTFVIQALITGPGNLLKTGSGTTLIENINTYTGSTLVNAGTLSLDDLGSISTSPTITIASGATINVSARTDDSLELASGQTLTGAGRVLGNLTNDVGATVAPGSPTATGALTVTNTVTLLGTALMKLDAANTTNDLLTGAQSIAYGGTLTVSNFNGTLAGGQTFKLFTAGSYSGAFAVTNLPTLAGGLSWNTANLNVNGSISVSGSSGPGTNANILGAQLSGTNVIFHGTNNNVPNTSFHYVVLVSPSLTNALSNWTPVVTNPFNPDGTFNYTNPIVPGVPRQFIDVKAVP